jgi:hypothetical protein
MPPLPPRLALGDCLLDVLNACVTPGCYTRPPDRCSFSTTRPALGDSSPSSRRSSPSSRCSLAARRRALAAQTAPPAMLRDCSGKHSLSQTTEHVILLDHARGLVDHISRCARKLLRSLFDHSLMTDFLGYMWNWTHIKLRDHYFLDLATRFILRLPASSGTTSVRCTCRCISVSSFHEDSFKTLAPRVYVTYYQTRGLSGHTSPCGECACFFDPYTADDQRRYTSRFTFLHRNPSGHTS